MREGRVDGQVWYVQNVQVGHSKNLDVDFEGWVCEVNSSDFKILLAQEVIALIILFLP